MRAKVTDIRPHHGMCLSFFRGEGYSDGFTGHMWEMKEYFMSDPQVRLMVAADEICRACPHNQNGACESAAKVEQYDRAVLKYCGLEEGQVMSFLTFFRLVREQILEKECRAQICGDCQWDGICRQPRKNRFHCSESVIK
jgi:hypothetical protein